MQRAMPMSTANANGWASMVHVEILAVEEVLQELRIFTYILQNPWASLYTLTLLIIAYSHSDHLV